MRGLSTPSMKMPNFNQTPAICKSPQSLRIYCKCIEDYRFEGYEKISYKDEVTVEAASNVGYSVSKRPS